MCKQGIEAGESFYLGDYEVGSNFFVHASILSSFTGASIIHAVWVIACIASVTERIKRRPM